MGFYTPTWVRKLVKEDHKNIQKYLENQRNDFRSYIDANTPFVLWLDIGLIRERILDKSKEFIKELAFSVSQERDVTNIVIKILDTAYIRTIDAYANNPAYIKIDEKELEQKLTSLSNAELGGVKKAILNNFKRTMVVSRVTKPGKSVMLILPKFTTLEFGKVFRKELEDVVNASELHSAKPVAAVSGMFAQLVSSSATADDSEKSRMLAFVQANFAKLQNIGHVEVDVISEGEKKVLRGQNSPRLLQALVTLPNDIKSFERLQLKFSKETGQAKTRVKIRKQFTGSKLIFELLIEHGLAVGIPESQKDNLYKATLERAFSVGAGLTNTLRKNIGVLANLETSKTVVQYLNDNVLSILKTGKELPVYNSLLNIQEVTPVVKTSVTLGNTKKTSKTSSKPKIPKIVRTVKTINLVRLQNLINQSLVERIKQNMGRGDRRDILNLRSGRFAESVKVERMSQSREGMITAFYSYMKNPYATFSEGGQQSSPRTRDPKLLIARSIREIAAQQVENRLRSVAV